MVIRSTRSGSISSSMLLHFLPSLKRGGTTMKSRRDRVVRARTASNTTMPEQRSRKVFTWVSVSKGNSCTVCAVIPP